MTKSVKRYMIVDLIVLAAIGFILEALVCRFIGFALDAAPTITISLLILFIAIVRWNLWGLLLVPILAAAPLLGGHFSDIPYFSAFYTDGGWKLYLSIVVGLASLGVNVLFFRNHKTNGIVKTGWALVLILLMDYVLYCGLQFVVYRLFTSGNLAEQAIIEYPFYVTGDYGEKLYQPKNLAFYGENGFIYNIYGLAVAVIGIFVTRSQGVLHNAVDKLVDDKKAREAEMEYLNSIGNERWDKPYRVDRTQDESNNKEKNQDSSKQ